jgi:hypothetical protein
MAKKTVSRNHKKNGEQGTNALESTLGKRRISGMTAAEFQKAVVQVRSKLEEKNRKG